MTSPPTGAEAFYALHRHGFVRVAACTPHVRPADVGFNRDAILAQARRADAAGVDLAVFPELCVSSYAIDDLHLQTALLDAVDAAIGEIAAASEGLAPVFLIGAPLRHRGRLYNCGLAIATRHDPRRGAEELPPELPRVLREALVLPRPRRRRRDHPGRRPRGALRLRPPLRGLRPPRLRLPPRDLRGLLGGGPALLGGGARRRHHPRQPLRLATSPSASPTSGTCSAARQSARARRRLRLFRRRPRREHHRPRLGRPGRDLRARRPPRRVRRASRWSPTLCIADVDTGRILGERMRMQTYGDAAGTLRPPVPPPPLRAPPELRATSA